MQDVPMKQDADNFKSNETGVPAEAVSTVMVDKVTDTQLSKKLGATPATRLAT